MLDKIAHTIQLLLNSVVLSTLVALGSITMAHVAHGADETPPSSEQLRSAVAEKNYSKALGIIAALPSQAQQQIDIRFYRATSLAGVGQNGEAIEAFVGLIEDEPQYPEFYNNLAMLLVEEGKLLEAQQALELGLRSRESYAMLYNNLTVVFETMARRSYAKALRIKKEQSPVLTPLVRLEGFTPTESVAPAIVMATADVKAPQSLDASLSPETIVEQDAPNISSLDTALDLNQQIELRLHHWLESWQNKDVTGYIDSYSPNFKSRAYSSREAWLRGRGERIERAQKIDISIEQISISALSPDRVQADFIMDYRSDRYSDRTKKRVVFKLIEGQWRIVRELTLKVMNS